MKMDPDEIKNTNAQPRERDALNSESRAWESDSRDVDQRHGRRIVLIAALFFVLLMVLALAVVLYFRRNNAGAEEKFRRTGCERRLPFLLRPVSAPAYSHRSFLLR